MADITIKGLSELQKLLDQFPVKMEKNIMRGALRAGANVIKNEAKNNVPVKTGTLKDGIKVSVKVKYQKVTASIRTTGKHAYLANWIEHGTRPHEIRPKNRKSLFFAGLFHKVVEHPGIVNPKPFMRPALDNKATEAAVAVGEYIKNRLATKNGMDTSDINVEAES